VSVFSVILDDVEPVWLGGQLVVKNSWIPFRGGREYDVWKFIKLLLCRPDIRYAVTTLAKFSTAPNVLHYKSLKHLAICLRQTQDWGIMHWHMEPVDSLPEVPHTPMKFDDSLPVIPLPSHL